LTSPVENKRTAEDRAREPGPKREVAQLALIGCAAGGVDDALHFNLTQAIVMVQTSMFFCLHFP
jgi:hypothetical protein